MACGCLLEACRTPSARAAVLNPVLGYDRVAQITTKAVTDGIPPQEATIALGLLTGEEYDRLVDARAMTTLP
jgi:fumarate hydratase, class II